MEQEYSELIFKLFGSKENQSLTTEQLKEKLIVLLRSLRTKAEEKAHMKLSSDIINKFEKFVETL